MRVVTAKEMRELDRRAAEEFGLSTLILMENAGLQAALELLRFFPSLPSSSVAVVCGKGNNGGDGFVCARHLLNRGVDAKAYLLARREEVKGDARINLEILERMRPIREVASSEGLQQVAGELQRADVIVDAILGTGTTGPAKGLYAETIELLNSLAKPIVSLDLPSGLNADEAIVPGSCIQACLTITFALPKRCLLLYPAAQFAGTVQVVDIGIPGRLLADPALKVSLLEAEEAAEVLPPRDPHAHKGTFGHVLVVAGSVGKTGAAALCSLAALRVGAGLVTLALPESLNDAMEVKLTEVMTAPLPETEERTLAFSALERILALSEGKAVLAIGPGLSIHSSTAQLVRELLGLVRVPMVIDADAINALAQHPEALGTATVPLVLTPHPGELSRFLSIGREEVLEKRIPIAQKVAGSFNLCLVLKGARTLVADPKGRVWINPTGNSGMATAGTGDVLTGVIGGFIAQGMEPVKAALAGVYLHGLAGDLAAEEVGEEAMVASDLLNKLPKAIQELKAKRLSAKLRGRFNAGREER